MVRGLNRVGLCAYWKLLLLACSSDESGVLTPDGAVEPLDALGTGGSAIDGSVVEEAGGGPSTDCCRCNGNDRRDLRPTAASPMSLPTERSATCWSTPRRSSRRQSAPEPRPR